MSNHIKRVNHKGKEIIHLNLSGLDETGQIKAVDDLIDILKVSGPRSLRVVSETDKADLTSNVKKKVEETKMYTEKYVATAMVGLTGIKKLFAKAMVRDIFFASTLEEAMDWLAEQE